MTTKPINLRPRCRPPKPIPRIETSPERVTRAISSAVRPADPRPEDPHAEASDLQPVMMRLLVAVTVLGFWAMLLALSAASVLGEAAADEARITARLTLPFTPGETRIGIHAESFDGYWTEEVPPYLAVDLIARRSSASWRVRQLQHERCADPPR